MSSPSAAVLLSFFSSEELASLSEGGCGGVSAALPPSSSLESTLLSSLLALELLPSVEVGPEEAEEAAAPSSDGLSCRESHGPENS